MYVVSDFCPPLFHEFYSLALWPPFIRIVAPRLCFAPEGSLVIQHFKKKIVAGFLPVNGPNCFFGPLHVPFPGEQARDPCPDALDTA